MCKVADWPHPGPPSHHTDPEGPVAGEGRGFLGFAEAPQARAPLGRQCLCPAYSEGPQGHDQGGPLFPEP